MSRTSCVLSPLHLLAFRAFYRPSYPSQVFELMADYNDEDVEELPYLKVRVRA
jgi:hypothetical protein